jgi:hypothetical protein
MLWLQGLAHGVRLRSPSRTLHRAREPQRRDVVEVRSLAVCVAPPLRVIQPCRFRCRHVNLVEKSNIKGEKMEFLFAPFSVFTVVSVSAPAKPTASNPIVIALEASIDNRDEPDALPISPWNYAQFARSRLVLPV